MYVCVCLYICVCAGLFYVCACRPPMRQLVGLSVRGHASRHISRDIEFYQHPDSVSNITPASNGPLGQRCIMVSMVAV